MFSTDGNMHRNSLRERYEKRRKERQDILGTGSLLESTEDKKSLILTEGWNLLNVFVSLNVYSFFS